MHPRTDELLQHITHHRTTLRAALDAVPLELRERAPAAGRWSVAQILEHLAVVEAQIATLLRRGVRTAMAQGPLPPIADQTPVLPTIDGALLLDRERRIQAGPNVQPKQSLSADAAWQALTDSRAQLVALLHDLDGKCTDAVQAPHPVLGSLTLHQWFAFTGFHEARHAAQVRSVMFELGAR
jgi:uncharacterized damage-inducible protein DinB